MEGIKKQRVFKDIGLDLIIDCNMKIVHYLDVTFNLSEKFQSHSTKNHWPKNQIP